MEGSEQGMLRRSDGGTKRRRGYYGGSDRGTMDLLFGWGNGGAGWTCKDMVG